MTDPESVKVEQRHRDAAASAAKSIYFANSDCLCEADHDEIRGRLTVDFAAFESSLPTDAELTARIEELTRELDEAIHARNKAEQLERVQCAKRSEAFAAQTAAEQQLADAVDLVGRLEREATVANDVIRLNRDGRGQGRIRVATAMHRIAVQTRAFLASIKEQGNG